MLADPAADQTELTARVAAITPSPTPAVSQSKARSESFRAGPSRGDSAAQGGSPTDPSLAAEFVAATGVDLLAVSVGNVHIKTSGDEGLDLALLEEIRNRVPVPLVLHGGTGISPRVAPRARSRSAWPR